MKKHFFTTLFCLIGLFASAQTTTVTEEVVGSNYVKTTVETTPLTVVNAELNKEEEILKQQVEFANAQTQQNAVTIAKLNARIKEIAETKKKTKG